MATRGRPIEANQKERIGYEQIAVRIPPSIKNFLDALPRWNKGEFVRQAIEEKIERSKK